LTLSIAAVERDTRLSKDILRVWERRYGFPSPQRDGVGERAYTLDQVEKLRVVKRLLDAGHRPGRIVPMPLDRLQELAEQTVDQAHGGVEVAMGAEHLRVYLDLIRAHDSLALRNELQHLMARHGVARFITDVLGPLSVAVGDAWMRGQMEIFEEHAYTESVQAVVRGALAAIPQVHRDDAPRVLLTTLPGEQHGLSLLMVEARLALDGCRCVSLGVQTPVWDIALAARAYRSDVVVLSFTACMSPNQIIDSLTELRSKLPAAVHLWAGGSAPALQRRAVPGVLALHLLDELPTALQRWRQGDPAP
jgi:DNA-binding transcriptional MerR regulator/methylmalonyl-CoA mutase cobalamin-binding subunit